MPLGRIARGNPKATSYHEARQIFDLARLSMKDNFCDLGCGYGLVVRWASKRCEFAYGMENYSQNLRIAKQNVNQIRNAEIIKGDFLKGKLPNANVLYCVNTVDLTDFRRWNRIKRKNRRIVTFGPPPIPIKPVSTRGLFYLTRFPFELAKNRSEWFYSILGKRDGSWQNIERKFKKAYKADDLRFLKQDFKKKFP